MHSHGCAAGRPAGVRAQWSVTRRPLGVRTGRPVSWGPRAAQSQSHPLWRSRPSGKFRGARLVSGPAATRDSQYPQFNGAPWAPQGGGGALYSAPAGMANKGPSRARPGYELDSRRVRGALSGMRPTVVSAGGLASLLALEQEIEEDLHKDGQRGGDLDAKLDQLISMAKLAAAKAKKLSSASNSLGHYKYTVKDSLEGMRGGSAAGAGSRPPRGIDPVDRPVDRMRRERQERAAEFLEMTRGAAAALELRAKKVRSGHSSSLASPVETLTTSDDVESVTFSALPERPKQQASSAGLDVGSKGNASSSVALGTAHSLPSLPKWVSGEEDEPATVEPVSLDDMSSNDSPGLRAVRAAEQGKRKAVSFAEPEELQVESLQTELPPFLSDLVVEADASVPVRKVVRKALGASKVEGETELVSETTSDSGVGEDGLMWWRDSGTERGPNGLLTTWTHIRGVSADGKTEWAERWWNKADWSGMRESGAEKTGADAAGNVWFERWNEKFYTNDDGVDTIEQACEKRASQGSTEWEEKWTETHNKFGCCKRDAHKWCRVDNGAHAWNEKWGEEFDGWGGSTKYTDRWSENCDLGRGGKATAKWGDRWKQSFTADGMGHKEGATWGHGEDGAHGWEKCWGEEHNATGYVRKFGGTSDGSEHWDHWEKEDTWFEPRPNIDYAEKVRSSEHLLSIAPAERDAMEGVEQEEEEEPHKEEPLRANLESGAWPGDLASALALARDVRDYEPAPISLTLSDIEEQAEAAIKKVQAAIKYISPKEGEEDNAEESGELGSVSEAGFALESAAEEGIMEPDTPPLSALALEADAEFDQDAFASLTLESEMEEGLAAQDLPDVEDEDLSNSDISMSDLSISDLPVAEDEEGEDLPISELPVRGQSEECADAEDAGSTESRADSERGGRETTSSAVSGPPPPPLPLVEAPPPPKPQAVRYGGAAVAPAVPDVAGADADAKRPKRSSKKGSKKGGKKSPPPSGFSGFM